MVIVPRGNLSDLRFLVITENAVDKTSTHSSERTAHTHSVFRSTNGNYHRADRVIQRPSTVLSLVSIDGIAPPFSRYQQCSSGGQGHREDRQTVWKSEACTMIIYSLV